MQLLFQGGPWADRLLDSAVTTAPEVLTPAGKQLGEYRRTEQQCDSSAVVYEWSHDTTEAAAGTTSPVAGRDTLTEDRVGNDGMKVRFGVEIVAAVAALSLAIVTLFLPEWIEAVFRLNPDDGGGALEWSVVFALSAFSIGLTFAARRQWRRLTAGA